MFKLLVSQSGWSVIGSLFAFTVGFFVKIYLVNAIGTESFGQYVLGQTLVITVQVFIALAIPQVFLRFLPVYIEKNDLSEANSVTSTGVLYLLSSSILCMLVMMFFNDRIASLFGGGTILAQIFFWSSLYIPLTLYLTAINSIYRSLFKIKELILYVTVLQVIIRALLTFIVFYFSNDVIHFIYIEIIALLIVVTVMTFKSRYEQINIFGNVNINSFTHNNDLKRYLVHMYLYALVGFFSSHLITLIMGLHLPSSDIGIYAILTTISGLASFILVSLNSVFAPIISKLHANGEMEQLERLFKDATFLINIITSPFILILVIFGEDVLSLYGGSVSEYGNFLIILIIGSYVNLFVGNTGMMLLMGGGERTELKIRIFVNTIIAVCSMSIIPYFGLLSAVIINSTSLALANILQVVYIKKRFGFFPWDKNAFAMLLITLPLIGIFGFYEWKVFGSVTEYLSYSLSIVLAYILIFNKKLISLYTKFKLIRKV